MTFTQWCNDANIKRHHCSHARVWLWKPNIVTFRPKWLLIIVTTGSRTGWLDVWCFCPLLHWLLIGQERNWHFGGVSDLSFKWLINSLSMPDICLLAAIFRLHVIIGSFTERRRIERERTRHAVMCANKRKSKIFLSSPLLFRHLNNVQLCSQMGHWFKSCVQPGDESCCWGQIPEEFCALLGLVPELCLYYSCNRTVGVTLSPFYELYIASAGTTICLRVVLSGGRL